MGQHLALPKTEFLLPAPVMLGEEDPHGLVHEEVCLGMSHQILFTFE